MPDLHCLLDEVPITLSSVAVLPDTGSDNEKLLHQPKILGSQLKSPVLATLLVQIGGGPAAQ